MVTPYRYLVWSSLQRLSRRSEWVLPANGDGGHIDPMRLSRGVARCQQRFKEGGIGEFVLLDISLWVPIVYMHDTIRK